MGFSQAQGRLGTMHRKDTSRATAGGHSSRNGGHPGPGTGSGTHGPPASVFEREGEGTAEPLNPLHLPHGQLEVQETIPGAQSHMASKWQSMGVYSELGFFYSNIFPNSRHLPALL